jgi:hypothetical protein
MAKYPRPLQHRVPYTHRGFLPYVSALGQLTLEWNGLHETLAMLFCLVMGGGFVGKFLAIWHALKVDRAQRGILLAAVKSDADFSDARRNRLIEDISWICAQADVVEEARNNALHSPLFGLRSPEDFAVVPITGLGHIRAQKLSRELSQRKGLLAEFRWCRDAAHILNKFSSDLDLALRDSQNPWPDRPEWPIRKGPNVKKRHPRG